MKVTGVQADQANKLFKIKGKTTNIEKMGTGSIIIHYPNIDYVIGKDGSMFAKYDMTCSKSFRL